MFRQIHSYIDSHYSANRAVWLSVCPLLPGAPARDALSARALNAARLPSNAREGF